MALRFDGASPAIVYGVFPAAGQLLVIGAAVATMAAAREGWRTLGIAIAVVALGTGSAFAGPARVWGIIAVGGCGSSRRWQRYPTAMRCRSRVQAMLGLTSGNLITHLRKLEDAGYLNLT